nr:EpsD family peptidyl-prolyl cis-trans isomerase [Massilia polaris]
MGVAALILAILAAALAACGDRQAAAKKPGQAIASVNGEEITTMQLNEELQRANVASASQQAASRQLVRVLIDRQLLQHEAEKEKLDRDPKVMQAIERARALIIAQAYMQKHIGTQARPTRAEVEAYFNQHPEFFSKRRAFDMQQLVIATRDLTPEVKKAAETSTSLEGMVLWFDANKIKYARNRVARSTAEMPAELSARLLSMRTGQIFAVREGERSLLVAIAEVREAPVTVDVAAQQIEQFLVNKKNKDAADA